MTSGGFATARPDDYLARVAASDAGRGVKARASDLLGIAAGDVVVDIGCGPGTDLARFADATGPMGGVVGVDRDDDHLERARTAVAGHPHARVERGDAAALPLPPASVDRAHTDRVLQHVDDPAAVLVDVRRVLRPGGRAVFVEPDWDTLVVDHADPRLADTYRRFVVEHVVRNARVGRELARHATTAGLEVVHVEGVTSVFTDAASADTVLGFARVTARAVAAGYLTDDDAATWLAGLREGPFLAAVTTLLTVVERSQRNDRPTARNRSWTPR